MSGDRPRRAMWLLNHKSARQFEIPMLKRTGFQEIFLPKSFPQEHNFRSADVDCSEDQHLTIPSCDLEKLNATNWYAPVSRDVWEIANRHFDMVFFILHNLDAVDRMATNFQGAMVLRAYGLDASLRYGDVIGFHPGAKGRLSQKRHRVWLAEAYEGIGENERWLNDRSVFLPLGLANADLQDRWIGTDDRILFICPEIASNPYYKNIYRDFSNWFKGLPYLIGGAQPIPVEDPSVIGFIPSQEFEKNMQNLKVMFYHSSEPRHIHYHPFEAIRAGMPLVFMAGGVLEKLAGRSLPGQAATIGEARKKIEQILRNDKKLIYSIRESQTVLLDAMAPDRLEPHWIAGMKTILSNLDEQRLLASIHAQRTRKVAVILPIGYRGGSMRAAQLLAEALLVGSRQYGEEAQIVFAYPDEEGTYSERDFEDLPPGIQQRPFRWKELDSDQARAAMALAQDDTWEPKSNKYWAPDDGINNLLDCDAWVVVSDRVAYPILPIRPRIHVVYDYIQRYVDVIDPWWNRAAINAALGADHILVTTEFSLKDAIQYAGVRPDRVTKVPMLAPSFKRTAPRRGGRSPDYFMWTTNVARHKNHERALKALSMYYRELGGQLDCYVTSPGIERLLDADAEHMRRAAKVFRENTQLKDKVKFLGELTDGNYRSHLVDSAFLWHPGLIDNGTFSVIEAASLGVPSLSSNYPAMKEIDQQFALNLTTFDPTNVSQMAHKLKWMEENFCRARDGLPDGEALDSQALSRLASAYWGEVREWL